MPNLSKPKHINPGRIALFMVLLIAIVLSIKSIREPDLWWQLRTGEWMLENQQITKQDVFSYSYEGVDWFNVKWGYEILQALTAKAGGPEFIPFLQVIFSLLLMLVLIKTTSTFGKHFKGKTFTPGAGTALVLFLFLWITEWRMTGRPETVSHLMTASFALLFINHQFKPSKWIFLIIPLQILWANLHEAYGMGIVLVMMFTVISWIENKFTKKTKKDESTKTAFPYLLISSVLAVLSVAINPRGFSLISHPIEIFSQLGENKYTIELYSFLMPEFWTYRSVMALLLLFTLCLLVLKKFFAKNNKKKNKVPAKRLRPPLAYWFFILAMLELGLSASRNVPFLMIAISPLLAYFVDDWLGEAGRKNIVKKASWSVVGLGVIFYIAVVSGNYYKAFNPRDTYGMEINAEKTPTGAAAFIQENKIEGNAFTDFLSSSYLLWQLQPDFKTFIDLRDLDIFPPVFFKNNFMLYQFPERVFPLADEDMNFDYIVLLNNAIFGKVHHYLLSEGKFELVYGDNLASVYLRKSDRFESLCSSYGYEAGAGEVFHPLKAMEVHLLPRIITGIFNPFHVATKYTDLDYVTYREAYYQYLGLVAPASRNH